MASLDALKCVSIFLVLWAHAIQHLTNADCVENGVYRWIYSFHMPLFMLISGYFSVRSMRLDWRSFVLKKLHQIALPGVTWPRLFALIGVLFLGEQFILPKAFTDWIPYWFLWAILICNVLAFVGGKFQYGRWVMLVVSQVIPFANVIYMYPAFMMGQLVYEHKDWQRKNIKNILMVSAIVYLISICFWGANDWHLMAQTQAKLQEYGIMKAGLFYEGKTVFKIVVNLSGSMLFFSLFTLSERPWNNWFGKALAFAGKYTLAIYIIQCYVLEVRLSQYVMLEGMSEPLFSLVFCPAIALGVMMFCVAVAWVVDFKKYSRFVLLGK